jgi:hypothetical protein
MEGSVKYYRQPGTKMKQRIQRFIGSRSEAGPVLSNVPIIEKIFEKDFDFEQSMQALFKLALVSKNNRGDGISLHPLIHVWCEARDDFESRSHHRRDAIIAVARTLDQNATTTKDWDRVCLHLDACVASIHQLLDDNMANPHDANFLHALDAIRRALEERNDTDAEYVFQNLYSLLNDGRGVRNALILTAQNRWASAMEIRDDPEKCKAAGILHEKNAPESLKYLGRAHSDTNTKAAFKSLETSGARAPIISLRSPCRP